VLPHVRSPLANAGLLTLLGAVDLVVVLGLVPFVLVFVPEVSFWSAAKNPRPAQISRVAQRPSQPAPDRWPIQPSFGLSRAVAGGTGMTRNQAIPKCQHSAGDSKTLRRLWGPIK
jgi:hypothetical protein